MLKKGFQIEHCRSSCPKSACSWQKLFEKLTNKLTELNIQQTLAKKFYPVHYHHLPKISLAGCPNGCSLPNIKDFGISGYVDPRITNSRCSECNACISTCLEGAITRQQEGITINKARCISCGDCLQVCPTGTLSAGERGWTLRYGGRVGRHPQFAKFAGQAMTDEEVVSFITKVLQRYIEEGLPQERLTHFLNSLDLSLEKTVSEQNARESKDAVSGDQKQ